MAENEQTLTEGTAMKKWAPTAKVSAGILAASITTLILPFLKKLTGSDLSVSDGAALTTLITFVIQYLVPERQ
jgi:hypothetical protein